MGYVLERDISFCIAGGRVIFLDLRRDRYFCLRSDAESAFKKVVAGETLAASEEAALAGAERDGWLSRVWESGRAPAGCVPPPSASSSALDRHGGNPDLIRLPPILFHLAMARKDLGTGMLRDTVRLLESQKKAPAPTVVGSMEWVQRVSATFQWSGLLSAIHDQCLPRSVAMMRYLVRRGYRPLLVFAVMTRPFAAHCWVQLGETVLNDRLDHVRKFTPILVV